ncbi:MAG: CopD family protein, partial [Actinomycetota bacterium]
LALLGLALAAVALRSHAASVGAWWAVPANALHLMAGALWSGGLVHLVLVTWRLRGGSHRAAVVDGAKRYAALALASAAAVMASGAVVAFSQFRETSQLLTTGYGRVLLVKLALVAATLGLALAARRRALGRSGGDANLLRRLTRPEAALLLLVIPVATVLANSTPPWAQTSRFVLGAPPLRGSVVRLAGLAGSPLAVHVAAVAGRLEVRVVDTLGEPARGVRVEIEGRAPAGTELAVSPRTCGPGCVTTAFRWQEGSTQLAMTVTSGEWGRGTARFSVPWPPGPRGFRLLDHVVAVMRAQPEIELTERVSSGLGAASEYTATLTGRRFVAQELYAAGGATDVREIPTSRQRTRTIVAYLPGSWIWYRLEIDETGRLVRETVVSPAHHIERTFRYPAQRGGSLGREL